MALGIVLLVHLSRTISSLVQWDFSVDQQRHFDDWHVRDVKKYIHQTSYHIFNIIRYKIGSWIKLIPICIYCFLMLSHLFDDFTFLMLLCAVYFQTIEKANRKIAHLLNDIFHVTIYHFNMHWLQLYGYSLETKVSRNWKSF